MANIMKTKKLLKGLSALCIMSLVLSGCITSVHPLFTRHDLIFRPELLGSWQEGDEIMTFKGIDSTYYSIQDVDKADTVQLIGSLGKLGNHYFLDITIDPDDKKLNGLDGAFLFPVHIFFKVSFENDQLTMNAFAFSSDWLAKLIRERRIRIKHEVENPYYSQQIFDKAENDQVLLTASTEELQKFVIKYADEPKAFENNPSEFKRITMP